MSDVIDFGEKKRTRDHIEESSERYTDLATICVMKTMELSASIAEAVRKESMTVSPDTSIGSAKLITASLLIRAACDELLRLADDDVEGHRISHADAKHLGLDLFGQYYDETLAHHKNIIENGMKQLFSILQDSKLVKAVGVKETETEAKAEMRKWSDSLETKGET